MDNLYTNQDIQEFLFTRGLEWDGNNKNKTKNDLIIAELKLSGGGDEIDVFQLSVTPISFYIYGLDGVMEIANFSQDWIINLIEKHPEKTSTIIEMIDNKMKEIYDFYEDAVKPYEQKIKRLRQEQRKALEELNFGDGAKN